MCPTKNCVYLPTTEIQKCRIKTSGKTFMPINHTNYLLFYLNNNGLLGEANTVWYSNHGRYSNIQNGRTLYDFFAGGNVYSYYDIVVDFSLQLATIIINGVSKSHAMTGWRIGYTAAHQDIIRIMTNIQSHSTSNPSSISQYASTEALNGDQASVVSMKKQFMERRDYMVENIK